MPTPAYTNLDSNKPSGSDSPTTYATDNIANIRALRDMVITGRAAGFVQSRTTGTGPDASRPQYLTWLNSTLQIGFRMKSTWGGTGNCQQTSVEWEWTNDNGSSWTTLGTAQANTFDSSDNITATTNSGGFVALVMEIWTKVLRLFSQISIDATNSRVGIGATSPSAKLDVNGNFAITGSARRILGDFSNSTLGNRTIVQTATSNSGTGVFFIPNGTGVQADVVCCASSDPANTAYFSINSHSTQAQANLIADKTGAGAYYPIVISAGGSERFRITTDGRFYGTALHNNAGAVTGTTNQYIASGTTAGGNATAVTNVTGTPTYSTLTWLRVGNVVTVGGSVSAQATTAGTPLQIRFPLPIASAFTAAEDCSGTGYFHPGGAVNGHPAEVIADTTNDQALVEWVASNNSSAFTVPIHFTYLIK